MTRQPHNTHAELHLFGTTLPTLGTVTAGKQGSVDSEAHHSGPVGQVTR